MLALIKLLFVCTGNICRSPTAEGVFRHLAAQAGLEKVFHIDSAGTDSYHVGEQPDERAMKVAAARGVALESLRARRFAANDFSDFDHILAMDRSHLRALRDRAPDPCRARVAMFLANGADVPDPWYGTEKDFESVYLLIEGGARMLLEKLRKDHSL